ncbi:hypothetical protein [Streptomyces sp. NPDC058382]|uniref:hypothetical protein n=1 Tax=unclassified Streptomyces TaxID=2593676 RepID=UPI003634C00E
MAHQLLPRHCDERSRALRPLLHAEITQFPELLETTRSLRECRLREALGTGSTGSPRPGGCAAAIRQRRPSGSSRC